MAKPRVLQFATVPAQPFNCRRTLSNYPRDLERHAVRARELVGGHNRQKWKHLLLGSLMVAALLGSGCTTVGVHEQRLVSKPNMQFSRSMIYSYDARLLSQVQPGRDATGGAQASSCTLCR
jgi:hypothetical protein